MEFTDIRTILSHTIVAYCKVNTFLQLEIYYPYKT
ncbi:hypothetical protein SAMN05421747_1143 [Parapedobacter composti]|uniref:Uncharacterized protein n=1 Tax=Parapedobacter composti TaxID=623281 RepID=A0A1I1K8Q3_9SPHI|nr:hypothetical protein SAMN05421747_1143 [Parapedobacter composti]